MKTQKNSVNLLLLIAVLFFTVSAGTAQDKNNEKENIEIVITKTTTKQEIDKLTADLKNKGATLRITKLKYNKEGQINKIKGAVDFHDDHSGAFESTENFEKLVITRNYNKDAKKTFGIVVY